MNKKLPLALLVSALLASCGSPSGEGGKTTESKEDTALSSESAKHNEDIYTIYNLYVEEKRANGEEPLSYEDWLATIKGEPGERGPKGDIGEQGPQGERGDNGKSAYEIYKEAHPEYEGDEQQWLDDLVNGRLGTEEPTTYTVTFDLGYGGRTFTQEVVDGKKVKKPEDPERNGYYFLDWVDGNNDHWVFNGYCVTEDITLYAVWSDPIDYTVTFVNDDGEILGKQSGHYGDTIVYEGAIPAPSNPNIHYNYTFSGWDKELIITGDMTLTAQYLPEYVETTAYYYDSDKTTLLGSVVLKEGEKPAYPLDESELQWRDDENKITHEFGSWEQFEETKDSIKFYAKYRDDGLVDGLVIEDGVVKGYTGDTPAIRIPEKWQGRKVTKIDYDGLGSNDNLTKVFIPKTVTTILTRIFFYSHNVRAVEVDAENPNYYAVDNVIIDKRINEIVACAPAKRGHYTVPEGIESIGSFAFFECTSLTAITLPDTVKTIKYSAFGGCYFLESIDLGAGIESIEGEAFGSCYTLKSIALPATVKDIAGSAFQLTTGNKAFSVDSANPTFKAESGVLFSKDGKTLIAFPCGKGGDYEIPETVEALGEGAFSGNNALDSVKVPGSIKTISRLAFYECYFTELVLEEGIERLEAGCLSGLYALNTIRLPYSIKTIERDAISHSRAVTSIYIGAKVESLDPFSFSDLPSLSNLVIDEENEAYSSVGNVVFNKEKTTLIFYPLGNSVTYAVPEGVVTIGTCAFFGNSKIENVTFPSTLKTIESQAFDGCDSLKHVRLNQGIEKIVGSFSSNQNLATILLPKSLKHVSCLEFQNDNSLEKVFYEGTHDELDDILDGRGWGWATFTADSPFVYFYAESKPETEGHYWRYVDGEPAAWEY